MYEEVEAVTSIEDAIVAGSFYVDLGPPAMTTAHAIDSGDGACLALSPAPVRRLTSSLLILIPCPLGAVPGARAALEAALAKAKAAAGSGASEEGGDDGDLVVVEGSMRVGGQEHFYLEPNVTMVKDPSLEQ